MISFEKHILLASLTTHTLANCTFLFCAKVFQSLSYKKKPRGRRLGTFLSTTLVKVRALPAVMIIHLRSQSLPEIRVRAKGLSSQQGGPGCLTSAQYSHGSLLHLEAL